MQNFLMLFRSDFKDINMDPAAQEANMQRWAAWLGKLGQEGLLVSAERLSPEGRTVAGTKMTVSDGPFAEAKEMVGGILIVKANDFDHAVELSKGCPMFEMESGNVEIRPIIAM